MLNKIIHYFGGVLRGCEKRYNLYFTGSITRTSPLLYEIIPRGATKQFEPVFPKICVKEIVELIGFHKKDNIDRLPSFDTNIFILLSTDTFTPDKSVHNFLPHIKVI